MYKHLLIRRRMMSVYVNRINIYTIQKSHHFLLCMVNIFPSGATSCKRRLIEAEVPDNVKNREELNRMMSLDV